VAQCFQFLPKQEKRVEYCWDQFYLLSHVWLLEKLLYLEYLQQCSVCDRAQYNWMKKIQPMRVWLRKMVLAPHSCARKRRSSVCTWKKSVINMI
jgi:hypothetical protein